MFGDDYDLQLTTNGSHINSFPAELFKKFQAIEISLYGLTADEYLSNTGCFGAFNQVRAGCIMLSEADVDFRVALVINNDNWCQMEDYVRYAICVGTKRIGFALPSIGGKLLLDASDKWHLTAETKKMIYRKFRDIQNKLCTVHNNRPCKIGVSAIFGNVNTNARIFKIKCMHHLT